MNRKNILFIQNNSHLYPLDEKIKILLPHIKVHYKTFVETVRFPVHKYADQVKNRAISSKIKTKLILRAVKFDLVCVRNILDVNFLRGLRLANDNLVLELSHPEGSVLDLFVNGKDAKKQKIRRDVERAAKTAKTVLVDGDHQLNILKKMNNNISLCPPVFPHKLYPSHMPEMNEEVKTLGFAGTGEDREAVKSIQNALKRITGIFPDIKAVANSDRFFKLEPPIKFVYKKIDPEKQEEIFSDADIFVFPANRSRDDFYGNGLFVLHALAAKKPCIVWHTEIDRNIFTDGVDMFIVRGEDEFVEKLSLLIENQALRSHMAEHGYEKALKHFSPEVSVGFYLEIFNNILNRNR